MSKNTKKPHNPLAQGSKGLKKGEKKQQIQRNIEDFINDSDVVSDEDERIKPKMKRLKRKIDSSEEEQLLIEQQNSEDEWDPEGEEPEQQANEDFERYALADDEDLKQKEEQKKKKKKNNKYKDNEHMQKYIKKKQTKQEKKENKKLEKAQVQTSILTMLRNQKPKKKKDDFDDEMANIQIDEDISSISQMNHHEEKISAAEKKQIEEAMRISKQEMEKEQKKIYEKITHKENKEDESERFKRQMEEVLKMSIEEDEANKKKAANKKSVDAKKSRPKSAGKKNKDSGNQKGGPLSGLYIAMTGQFQPYKKGRLIELIQELGAVNPKSITKKATHLFQGAFVCDSFGRKLDQDPSTTSKSVEAAKRGLPIIENYQLDDFFIKYTGKTLEQLIQKEKKPVQSKLNLVQIEKTGSKTVQLEEEENIHKGIFTEDDKRFWTEKYKPRTLDDVIGQKSQINQLKEWLEAWEDVHIRGNKRDVKANFGSFLPAGTFNSSAALLSGDAGIGKTTTARLLAAQFNYGVVQYNASQARNKKAVFALSEGKDNFCLLAKSSFTKTLIIMDEIDGMSSGDRGGITAIIDMIKKTKVPIICICNDRQHTKIRALAGHCYDIKFHKPDKMHIVRRLQQIVKYEGGTCTHKGLQRLVEMMQNDMRQILTYLEFFFKTVSKQVSYDTIERHPGKGKDNAILINHFEASKRLMNRLTFQNMSISERTQLAFIDSDLVPLMVHENYLNTAVKKKMNRSQFHKVVKAAESMVEGDLVDRKIMRTQNYFAMPNKMFLTCVYPTEMVSQSCGFAKFTSWLGKFSSQRKNKRLVKELKYQLATSALVTTHSVKHNYSAMIFQWIVDHLRGSQPNIDSIIEFMDFYHISPVILNENLASLQLGARSDQLKNIPAANKAKLTRAYNAHHEKILNAKKAKAKATTNENTGKYDPVLGEMEIEVMQEQEENNEQNNESKQQEVKQTKKKAGKSKPKK